MRARRWLGSAFAARGAALVLLTLLGAAGVLAQPLGGPLNGAAAAATTTVPYTDPNAVGSIGLCNQAGQQITSGSISTTPFAWRAVSTQPAQAPYNNAGRTATLLAYLPLQALPAGDWSGEEMTSSSSYTNPANPMAAATDGDQSLQSFIEAYPPKWDGFVQLRMYLSTANHQAYEAQYPTLNIQVTGDTWRAVGGSPVNCASGTAVSIETVLLPASTTSTTSTPSTTTTTTVASGSGNGKGSLCRQHLGLGRRLLLWAGHVGRFGAGRRHGEGRCDHADIRSPRCPGHRPGRRWWCWAPSLFLVLRRRRLASTPLASESPLVSSSASSSSTKGDTP